MSKHYIQNCLQVCADWGLIPTEFRQCMTWEEQVLWLSKFLREQVIPAFNGLSEDVEQLENWFDNLDVQEEINNKLDEMAESGQLADIIAAYIQLKGVLAFDKVADIAAATNLVNGSYAKTYGYKRLGDGVSDLYKVRTILNTDVPDGYNLVAIAAAPTLVAERIQNGTELVIKLIDTDDIHDYVNLNACKTIIMPEGATYTLESPLYMTSNTVLDLNGGTLTTDYTTAYGESIAVFTYDENSTFTGYDGPHDITIKNGTIDKGLMCFMHDKNVTLQGLEFVNMTGRHCIQVAACYNFVVDTCIFNGIKDGTDVEQSSECINIDPCIYGAQPYIPETSPIFDGTKNMFIKVINNTFKSTTVEGYTYRTALGSHGGDTTMCDNLEVSNNSFGSPAWSAINLRFFDNVFVYNNSFDGDDTNPGIFILKEGSVKNIIVSDNVVRKCKYFFSCDKPCDASYNITIEGNDIEALDPNADSSAVIMLFNVRNSLVANNNIKCRYHAVHLNTKDYWDSTSVGSDGYCNGIKITGNVFQKTENSTSYVGMFRMYNTLNTQFCNNTLLHTGVTLQSNYEDLYIQGTDTAGFVAADTFSDTPGYLCQATRVTDGFSGNNAVYSLAAGTNATTGSGTFTAPLTKFSRLLIQIGSSANQQYVELKPYLAISSNKFDTDNRTWNVPIVKGDGTFGKFTLSTTNSSADYSFTCDINVRKIIAMD